MRNQKIDGIGSIHEGKYETISFDGIGKLKGDAEAKNVIVDGIFKGKGKLTTDEISIDGIARVFRNIKAKKVVIDGILKLRRASLNADKIICNGVIVGNREISADDIYIDGICSVLEMYGDNIVIKNNSNKGNIKGNIPISINHFIKMYFGRNISMDHSIVDIIECTYLEAEDIKAKIIRANNIKLRGNCIVDKLFCDGEMIIDDTCKINEIISNNKPILNRKEQNNMANASLVKILNLYKDEKINADEAEKMISSIGINNISNNKIVDLPWEDDGKFRIVAYIGRKLLKKGDPAAREIDVKYDGEALNVESYGNLTCGNVSGNVSVGASINCGDIGGNVSCGGNIRCKGIKGKVAAGGGIHIEN